MKNNTNRYKHYKRKKNITPNRIDTNIKNGLTIDQVNERIKMGYDNPETNKKSRSYLGIIASEVFTYFNLIFFILAIILIWVGAYTQILFLTIVFANLLIGIYQKIKSKLILEKLSLVTASSCKVIRDGQQKDVMATQIVIDDIIILSSGEQISCDSIVLSGELKVNESQLTGESLPVIKKKGDTVLSGSFVVSGTAYVKADKVGADTFVLNLTSQARRYKKPNSIILNTLNSIIKVVGVIIIPIAILLFYRTYTSQLSGANIDSLIYDTVIKTSGAILGMIPSGLFLLTSTTLVVGVIRLAKNNILVQELYCIEMLARVNVVCMDKTGTITDGSMVVKDLLPINKHSDDNLPNVVKSMLSVLEDDNATALALKNRYTPKKVYKSLSHYNFTSETKFSCVNFKDIGTYFMGAPELILNKKDHAKILKQVDSYASKGFRVLALCKSDQKYLGKKIPTSINAEALILLEDHIRQDAIDTIKYFKENQVALKVISGDNALTVSEVAIRAGVEGAENYISLDGLSDEEVFDAANKYTVFGRVVPHQKKILIQSIKKAQNTVAMIGDGVNDILALKEADCSIAIGGGTEAARHVSQLILTDSNFCSMKNVVAEGRRVTNNIKISSPLFLTKTIYSVILSIFCIIMAYEYPFSPVQLMIMESCAIGIPSFALALQPNRDLIKGKFLETIMIKSLIGALVALAISIFLLTTRSLTGLTQTEVESIIIIAITVNALFVIIRVSWPFNLYRITLIILMTILIALGFLLLSNLYGLALFNGTVIYNLMQISNLTNNGYNWLYIMIAAIPILLTIIILIEQLIYRIIKINKNKKITA